MKFDFKLIGRYLGQKEFWSKAGYTALGAVAGEVLPAMIQGLGGRKEDGNYRIDMSGALGNFASGSIVTAIGLGFDKPYIALGTLITKGTKLLYVYGNPYIAKIFNSPIPPATKNSIQVSASLPAVGVQDDMPAPAGMEYVTRPDGTKILVSSGPSGETVNDSMPLQLEPANVASANVRYGPNPLADYSNNPFNLAGFNAASLNDDWEEFANGVAYGNITL